ncbi:pentatricopeptide repeat-containing protein At5g52850, chloroplastic [Magnolia sinica]|uniref:pentatricopeptide repeat-containing protein At5g52850, chloroplastic n=1 Tax=Magnolia sinica TaxID=86752 RepID=UPI002657E4E8|nr:pentatricopeptide repeat-containing protein At5g52850, chloroplastic [Magnolia sinica]XP_058068636.1 pentatricopeptide repeat-containing protein At5g52850, chloroplastic [Magnolia sinica]XP_058068637.1 pentatricopeptide repeat-containing protein At5g52850, chloroplastic [Magnolia sinica]
MTFTKLFSCCFCPCWPTTSFFLLPPKYHLPSSLIKPLPLPFLTTSAATAAAASIHNSSSPSINTPWSEEFFSWALSFSNSSSLQEGTSLHSPIIKLGLHHHLFLNNLLLSLYSKCSAVGPARNLFDGMSIRDVVSWTTLISAYVRQGNHVEALELFGLMVFSGFTPNEFTFSTVLRSCSSLGDLRRGLSVHTQILKRGFGSNLILASALINFYSKCDEVDGAFGNFKAMMNNHDTVSWTTMISACTQAEDWTWALRLYYHMIAAGIPPNEFTFVKLLMAAGSLGMGYGELVHAHVILWGVQLNLVLKTALADMYSKCQRMGDALRVLNQTSESDVLLWTAMICGYNQVSDFEGVIAMFRRMELAGISLNPFAYAGILNACSSVPAPVLGKQIHSRTIKAGMEHDVSVGNALVDMYMKCCSAPVEEAMCVFRGIKSPNVISWTSLIAGFAQRGYIREAFQALVEMQAVGIQPNSFTLSSIVKSCGSAEAFREVRKLHAYIFKTKADSDIAVGNSLVDVYAQLGMLDDAWRVVKTMTQRDVITYTSLATGINQMGHHEMALGIISCMHDDDVKMDGFSLATFLSASASLAAMEPGKQLHCYSIKSGLDYHISVSNGLVDMYGKCGSINDIRRAFAAISEPNVVSWNGLISGLASNGHFSGALSSFEDMRLMGTQPDGITFLLVLYACSHGGLVDLGLEYFNSMTKSYGILQQFDHYICLVDLLGRAGRLEEATGVIETMPFEPDALIYKTLLGSCKIHGNLALGEDAAMHALKLDSSDPAIYVLLSNMYDDAGQSESGELTRRMMREKGLRKNPGQSWIEIRNKVFLFTSGDRSNPQVNEMHEMIESLTMKMKSLGYDYGAENRGSYYHSEKLAFAFGLLNAPSAAPIRIIKNLRICGDCHTFMKLVTQLIDREVVVRDGNRFHSFNKGDCSCGGYW